jgi:hypothetical protein
MNAFLERHFGIMAPGSKVRVEVLGGLSTFRKAREISWLMWALVPAFYMNGWLERHVL